MNDQAQKQEKKGLLVRGEFPLSSEPYEYVVNLHMRNLIQCYEVNYESQIPVRIYRRNFRNWVATFGVETVESALKLMNRDLRGRILGDTEKKAV